MTVFERITQSPETLAREINLITRCDAQFELNLAAYLKEEAPIDHWTNRGPADYDIDLLRRVNEAVKNIGKYVIWNNGIGYRLYYINGVNIYPGEIRYDLNDLCPIIDHRSIVRIVDREEAKAIMAGLREANG